MSFVRKRQLPYKLGDLKKLKMTAHVVMLMQLIFKDPVFDNQKSENSKVADKAVSRKIKNIYLLYLGWH